MNFKNKTKRFYVGLAGALLAILSSIAYIATDMGDRTFDWIVVALMVVGALIYVVTLFVDLIYIPLISTLCYGAGFAYMVYLMLPTMSDIWNNVNFIGGNPVQATVFTVLDFICVVLGCIACFGSLTKE